MSLGEKWFRRLSDRGLAWMHSLDLDFARSGFTRVRAHSALVPIGDGDGALLIWNFDRKPGATQVLLVRLTETEANRVYDADPLTVGLIEPVRRHLASPWAIMTVTSGPKVYSRPYRIPRRTSEKKFVELLDTTAATCPAFHLEHSRLVIPEVERVAQRVARDLAFA